MMRIQTTCISRKKIQLNPISSVILLWAQLIKSPVVFGEDDFNQSQLGGQSKSWSTLPKSPVCGQDT
jgi:hypothetical protein